MAAAAATACSTIPRVCNVGSVYILKGSVAKVSGLKFMEKSRGYVCQICRFEFTVKPDHSQFGKIAPPTTCENPEECASTKFVLVADSGSSDCSDYQEVIVQESLQHLEPGRLPQAVSVVCEGDLVDCCQPGDDVQVAGMVLMRWQPLVKELSPDVEIFIKASEVTVMDAVGDVAGFSEDYFAALWTETGVKRLSLRNKIIASICPGLCNMALVKLAVGLILAGGVSFKTASGTSIRGSPHLLLVGDPGTGKSQLIRAAARLLPRSVFTCGAGASAAGLGCTAVKEDGCWGLEAGALVLADRGICCIDELSTLREPDRVALHEAMEQQTLSLAKAGLVAKLNTRCSLLASTNSRLDHHKI